MTEIVVVDDGKVGVVVEVVVVVNAVVVVVMAVVVIADVVVLDELIEVDDVEVASKFNEETEVKSVVFSEVVV